MTAMLVGSEETIAKIRELEKKATDLQNQIRPIYKEIGEIYLKLSGGEEIHTTSVKISSKPHAEITKKRGRPVGSHSVSAKKHSKIEMTRENSIGLKEAIWEILGRSSSELSKLIEGYPKDAIGPQVDEIKHIIELEKKWTSKSDNVGQQISTQMKNFRDEGLVTRNEKRYSIVPGAQLVIAKRGRKPKVQEN